MTNTNCGFVKKHRIVQGRAIIVEKRLPQYRNDYNDKDHTCGYHIVT